MSGIIQFITLSKVEIVMFKNYIEIIILILMVPFTILKMIALLFVFLYFQYFAIKQANNEIMKAAWENATAKVPILKRIFKSFKKQEVAEKTSAAKKKDDDVQIEPVKQSATDKN